MTKKILKIIWGLGVFFLILAPFTLAARAETIIAEKDCQYNVGINIVFDFKDEKAKAQADSLLAEWTEGMNKIWNGDFGSRISSNNYLVNYNFALEKMAENKTCSDYPQDHCISVISADMNQRGNRADVAMASANNYSNSQGEWTVATTGLNAAHESGHLMGLKDEYHYEIAGADKKWVNDNYKQSGPQSIMAQTWGEVSAFSEQADEIIKNANLDLPVNESCSQNEAFQLQSLVNKFYFTPIQIPASRPEPRELSGALVKGETDSAVYLVDQEGKLRHLANEQVAEKIAGQDWSKKLIWFSDSIVYTYKFGEPIK